MGIALDHQDTEKNNVDWGSSHKVENQYRKIFNSLLCQIQFSVKYSCSVDLKIWDGIMRMEKDNSECYTYNFPNIILAISDREVLPHG